MNEPDTRPIKPASNTASILIDPHGRAHRDVDA